MKTGSALGPPMDRSVSIHAYPIVLDAFDEVLEIFRTKVIIMSAAARFTVTWTCNGFVPVTELY